ncbi:MAG: helix-turn-helix domain-containing protein [Pseudomonadota bacterium]|nr:helix-turn-helix domain-containing protein [Pseudomonadota bacterium]
MTNNIRRLRDERRITLEKLAEMTDISAGQLSRIEKGKRGLRLESALKIASALDVDLSEISDFLEGGEAVSLPAARPSRNPRPLPNASPFVPVEFPRVTIGIYGQVAGGKDGRFVLNGQKVMDVLCPPSLENVKDAYGVFVSGSSMEPRYFPGEAVFVNPHIPVRQGNFVIAQVAGQFEGDDPGAYVKQFVSMTSSGLVLRQFNTREGVSEDASDAEKFELRFPRDEVIAVHKIVATLDV